MQPPDGERDYDAAQPERRSEMPEVPDVSAIAQQVKARIKHIEDQLRQHEKLTHELERLRDALTRFVKRSRAKTSPRTTVTERFRRSTGKKKRSAPPASFPIPILCCYAAESGGTRAAAASSREV